MREEIETLQQDLDQLKAQRKETPKHISVDELPEDARFRQLATRSKQLIDSVKMIAYRAETAMSNSLQDETVLSRIDKP
ncbi:putative transposase [Thiorhodovibrio winogradskyi]|uniref:putative transposase n=1 Tax=Thiorhodovibrio winogradskyi TaxID=77007 RepID=UPI0038B5878F